MQLRPISSFIMLLVCVLSWPNVTVISHLWNWLVLFSWASAISNSSVVSKLSHPPSLHLHCRGHLHGALLDCPMYRVVGRQDHNEKLICPIIVCPSSFCALRHISFSRTSGLKKMGASGCVNGSKSLSQRCGVING